MTSTTIWHNPELSIDKVNFRGKDTLVSHIDIQVTELRPDALVGTMPVDERTVQPLGLLHGGASCVLAESLGSIASNLVVNPETHYAVGLSINASHLRSARSGLVTGIATPIHLGRQTHVWEIKITDDQGKLVCLSRLTMMVLEKAKT
jgi:1,4-dihydroxy-2-naphthoyl-CoA hydrolase